MFISSLTLCFSRQKMSGSHRKNMITLIYMYIEVACSVEIYYFCHMEKVLVKVSPLDICIFAWTRTYSSDHIHSYANDFALLVFGGKNLTFVFQGSKTVEWWYICTTHYCIWLNSSIIHKEHSLILIIYCSLKLYTIHVYTYQ